MKTVEDIIAAASSLSPAERLKLVEAIRGLRIPVATVVGMVAKGMSQQEILRDFPDLEAEDVHAALTFAVEAVRERELPLLHVS
jgi:hypothetical protein